MASATPILLLGNTNVSNCRENKEFKDLGSYSEWPKVADAVIKALWEIWYLRY
jgi:hypothetical protein